MIQLTIYKLFLNGSKGWARSYNCHLFCLQKEEGRKKKWGQCGSLSHRTKECNLQIEMFWHLVELESQEGE